MKVKSIYLFFLTCMLAFTFSYASEPKPAKPAKKDKCPVCGMFVYKYPDWVGEITFQDGSRFFFDGAKDLFKYYFNLEKYNPGQKKADIQAIFVTEYYDMRIIDAEKAFYVVGSDIYGPMGHELIPFETMDAAEEFKRDHRGRRILKFEQVKPSVIKKLD